MSLPAPLNDLPLVDAAMFSAWSGEFDRGVVDSILLQATQEAYKEISAMGDAGLRQDVHELKRRAHKLKGMLGNLGAVRIAACLRAIEIAPGPGCEFSADDIQTLLTRTLECMAQVSASSACPAS